MWEFLVIALCLVANGLIAATEVAFISLSKSRLKQWALEGDPLAEKLLTLRNNPERTLSVLQLGITFVGVVAAAVGGLLMDRWLAPVLVEKVGLPPPLATTLSILIFVVPYTYFNIVLSELLPKTLALRNPKRVLHRAARPLFFFDRLLFPLVFLLEKSTKFAVKWFPWKGHEPQETEELFSVGRLVRPYMVKLAKIETKQVKDVMVPWPETAKITFSASADAVRKEILATRHTRLPVIEDHEPVGILQAKEFLSLSEHEQGEWNKHLLPLITVQGDARLVSALKQIQGRRTHMAIVVKGKKPVGMVTIEDILEEVVGEIYDEDDTL